MAFAQVLNPSLTSNESTATAQLGTVWEQPKTGNVFRYVLVEDANLVAGDVVEYADTTGYEVTKDRAGGSSIGRFVAGVAVAPITDGNYGWIQVSGKATVNTDGAVVKGDRLVPHATVDGQADTEANGSTVTVTSGQVFGFALATDSGTTSAGTVPAIIRCL